MSIDELLPPSSAEHQANYATPIQGTWAGVFLEDAQGPSDQLHVRLPDADDSQFRHGPCSFPTRSEGLPRAGDPCLVAFDSDGDPWVVVWRPA